MVIRDEKEYKDYEAKSGGEGRVHDAERSPR